MHLLIAHWSVCQKLNHASSVQFRLRVKHELTYCRSYVAVTNRAALSVMRPLNCFRVGYNAVNDAVGIVASLAMRSVVSDAGTLKSTITDSETSI